MSKAGIEFIFDLGGTFGDTVGLVSVGACGGMSALLEYPPIYNNTITPIVDYTCGFSGC